MHARVGSTFIVSISFEKRIGAIANRYVNILILHVSAIAAHVGRYVYISNEGGGVDKRWVIVQYASRKLLIFPGTNVCVCQSASAQTRYGRVYV